MQPGYALTERPVPHHNQLLAALSKDIGAQVAPHLELVRLRPGDVVYEAGCAERYAHFPNEAIVSVLSVIESGKCVEISMVGNEGIVGIDSLAGGRNSFRRAEVHYAGTAYRMPVKLLKEAFNRHAELRSLVLRFMQSQITQMSQAAVCNRHHAIEQQVCRRLLLSLDRMAGDEITLTQDKIAYLLGVRREGITHTAGVLRDLGAIESRRGHIRVLDRDKLENLSCECYAVVKAEIDCLLPAPGIMRRHDGAASTPSWRALPNPTPRCAAPSALPQSAATRRRARNRRGGTTVATAADGA